VKVARSTVLVQTQADFYSASTLKYYGTDNTMYATQSFYTNTGTISTALLPF